MSLSLAASVALSFFACAFLAGWARSQGASV